MEVLADLVDDGDVLSDGYGVVCGEDAAAGERRGDGGRVGKSEAWDGLGALGFEIAVALGIAVAVGGGAFDLDAAAEQGKFKCGGGELGGVFDGDVYVEAGVDSAPRAHEHGAGAALDAGTSGFASGVGDHGVVEGVVVDVGGPGGNSGLWLGGIGADGEADGVLVEREGRDWSAIGPLQVVPCPGLAVGLVEKEGVVADDVAFDGAYSGLLDLLGEEVKRAQRREWGFGCGWCGLGSGLCWGGGGRFGAWRRRGCGRLVRVATGAECRVARADDCEVSMKDAFAIENAAGDDIGGPGERIDGKEAVRGCGGEELGVGRWDEEFGFVEAVEGLAIEGDHADAELGLIECGVGEDGGDAAGERTFGERGVGGGAGGRVMRRRRVRWGLGGKSDNSDCGRENG